MTDNLLKKYQFLLLTPLVMAPSFRVINMKYQTNIIFKMHCRDDLSRADWYDNVLFFSCLSGCRSQLRAERWLYIMVPAISALVLFLLLVICCVCKGCPLARWYRDSRAKTAKINPNQTPPPNPFLVSSIADFDAGK